MGRFLIGIGCFFIVLGTVLHFAPWLINWFGKLPGDIRIESDRTRVFIPITSMVLLSILLTLILNFFKH